MAEPIKQLSETLASGSFEFLKNLMSVVDLPAIFLCTSLVVYVLILLKWHLSSSPFDFAASLIDPPTPGSVSLSRLGQLTALVVSSDVLLYTTIKNQAVQDWMFAAYMAAWAGTYVAVKWAPKESSKPSE